MTETAQVELRRVRVKSPAGQSGDATPFPSSSKVPRLNIASGNPASAAVVSQAEGHGRDIMSEGYWTGTEGYNMDI